MALGPAFDRVLDAARADAAWAYERLYRDLSPSVCGYLRVQGAQEPDDLTSEVFLGAFRGLSTFCGTEDQFRSWVFTIAHRRLTDERRRVSLRPLLADSRDDHPQPDDRYGGDVEEDALRRMSAARVRTLCQSLSHDQRDVLLLRLVSDMTVEAIARTLGKTPGAVKALQRRALTTLREVLTTQGVPL